MCYNHIMFHERNMPNMWFRVCDCQLEMLLLDFFLKVSRRFFLSAVKQHEMLSNLKYLTKFLQKTREKIKRSNEFVSYSKHDWMLSNNKLHVFEHLPVERAYDNVCCYKIVAFHGFSHFIFLMLLFFFWDILLFQFFCYS